MKQANQEAAKKQEEDAIDLKSSTTEEPNKDIQIDNRKRAG